MDVPARSDAEAALRQFFMGLSDATRLRIAGQLAAGDASAEQLATALTLKLALVKHHLARLQAAGLAAPRAAGPAGAAETYALRLDSIHSLAGRVLARPRTVVPDGAASDAFERKVLKDYLTPQGALREIPLPEKKLTAVLRFVLKAFDYDRAYSEKEVNAALKSFHADSATLRRALVDRGWMVRQSNGDAYRRVRDSVA